MKKRLGLILTALVLCVASVFALSACFDNVEIEGNWEINADTKEDSLEVLDGFFEETLKDPNVVVTIKNGDVVVVTENVKGTDSCYVTNGTTIYSYKKGDFYYQAVEEQGEADSGSDITRYYFTTDTQSAHYDEDTKKYYDQSYCVFKSLIKLYTENLPDGTFTASNKGEEKNNESSATLTFDYSSSRGTLKLTATAENDLVKTVSIVIASNEYPEDSRTFNMAFVYGNAVVTLPDTDAWDREDAAEEARIAGNEQALNDKAEFFEETACADNVIVTISEGDDVSYVETIANGIDCIDYDYYKVYTYMEEVDEGTCDYYCVVDGGMLLGKSYSVNSSVYDNFVMFYYNDLIAKYDEFGDEGATLSCNVEDNTMTFTVINDGKTLATFVAVKEGDLVKSVTDTYYNDDDITVMTATFVYGTAELEKPDLSDFTEVPAEDYDDIEDDDDIIEE